MKKIYDTMRSQLVGLINKKMNRKEISSMYAVIDIGGKQYRVGVGDTIFVESLKAKEKESFNFNKVVAIVDESNASFGAPFLDGATVVGEVLKNGKQKKIRVFKYKPKKNYSRRYGHRQQYSKVKITAINA